MWLACSISFPGEKCSQKFVTQNAPCAPAIARAEGRVLRQAPGPIRGPRRAEGALVWVHQHYQDGDPPGPPPFLDRLTGAGWKIRA